MVNKLTKAFYNTILSQTFSPCGNYLAVGDIYGEISVFHLSRLINQENTITKEEQLPKSQFVVKKDVQINSLLTTGSFLIVGTVGEILGYSWKNVLNNKQPPVAWNIEISSTNDSFDKPDINYMLFTEENGHLYAGCGDNNVYMFDIETRKVIRTFQGHKNYVHCISITQNNQLASGSEDGQILLWDVRQSTSTNSLKPYTESKLIRDNLGKWIGGVDINDDWLLCGGGPRLSLWHLRTMNILTVFPIDDQGIHVSEIYQDKIFAGGRSTLFYQMSFNGDIITEIPTAAVTTYSAIHQEEPFQALCLAGSSPKIDICNNFIYKNLQLSLY